MINQMDSTCKPPKKHDEDITGTIYPFKTQRKGEKYGIYRNYGVNIRQKLRTEKRISRPVPVGCPCSRWSTLCRSRVGAVFAAVLLL